MSTVLVSKRKNRSIFIPIIALAAIIVVQFLLPLDIYPGPYDGIHVGYKEYAYTSPSRIEKYLKIAQPRKLRVQLYYPINSTYCQYSDLQSFEFQFDEIIKSISGDSPPIIPVRSFVNLDLARLPVCIDHPPKIGKYPLVIYHHGLGMGPSINDSLLLKLAARGYFVVSIGETYDGNFKFPDGQISSNIKKSDRSDFYNVIIPDDLAGVGVDILKGSGSLESKLAEYRKLLEGSTKFTERIDYWADDTRDVIENDILHRYGEIIDSERINYVGHSLGGAASGALCSTDIHCRSAVDIDGKPYGTWLSKIQPEKFLYISRENNSTELEIIKRMAGDGFNYEIIQDSTHLTLTDLARVSPLTYFEFSDTFELQKPIFRINYTYAVNMMERKVVDFIVQQNDK